MPTFYLQQFGCRATQADGAAIERQLLDRGCSAASSADSADFVILNTCTVTASADAQARDAIRQIHARNASACILVTGCYAQRAPEDLAALPGVSYVVGNTHKPQIPNLVGLSGVPIGQRGNSSSPDAFVPVLPLVGAQHVAPSLARGLGLESQALPDHPAPILTGDIFAQSEVLVAPVLGGEGNHTRPTLKIQDGCNSRCSFCVIPFVRGRSRSLTPRKVLDELNRLSASGFREIVLSGINLGTWGRDLTPRLEFIDLLRRILDETPVERLRISSIEPLDVTRDLVELFASTDRLAHHFHMPLQSGSDRILAAMHRWYRTEHYARRIEIIRELLPDAAIGADVIAGFPAETEEDHSFTLAFIERLPFTYLHVFSYSQRPGTRAAAFPNQVSPQIIKHRARELRALGEAKSAIFRRSQVGRTLRVLTLHPNETDNNAGFTPAISSNYLPISVRDMIDSNRWIDVQILSEGHTNLLGARTAHSLP